MVENGEKIKAGKVLVKIPRRSSKSGDITGGLPRITELLEARNPSNPAVVSEIDGVVSFGKIKRGNREIIISKFDIRKYLVKLSSQILFKRMTSLELVYLYLMEQLLRRYFENKGPAAVQQYLVNEIQEVYRLQG
jgi:DNA-directed RNA polymerase subunit beta'